MSRLTQAQIDLQVQDFMAVYDAVRKIIEDAETAGQEQVRQWDADAARWSDDGGPVEKLLDQAFNLGRDEETVKEVANSKGLSDPGLEGLPSKNDFGVEEVSHELTFKFKADGFEPQNFADLMSLYGVPAGAEYGFYDDDEDCTKQMVLVEWVERL